MRRLTPYLDDGDVQLYHGDTRRVLLELPAGICQTCVTSPPYYGLRDYGTATWIGGDPNHDHVGQVARQAPAGTAKQASNAGAVDVRSGDCACGAQRVDEQIGLEQTPDEYVEQIVETMRGVRHALRDDGTAWIVLGDSYAGDGGKGGGTRQSRLNTSSKRHGAGRELRPGLGQAKPKDLLMIPALVALALRADGWYLRAEIIWDKPNPMPESVADRPTKSDERIILVSKSERYFYDAHAIREPAKPGRLGSMTTHDARARLPSDRGKWSNDGKPVADERNARSVWRIATRPYADAHFATYPPELVARCIRAGTSEAGACSTCGAPWRRVVELVGGQTTGRTADQARAADAAGILHARYPVNGSVDNVRAEHVSRGFQPSCSCHADTIPQIVLDPFIGSGTTAIVARQMGRHAIGVDLNAEYLDMAAGRLAQRSLLT